MLPTPVVLTSSRSESAGGVDAFKGKQLKLTSLLMRYLSSTNIIENPNGVVRRVTVRVCRWRNLKN